MTEHMVKYGSYDLGEAEREEEEMGKGDKSYMKLGVGDNRARFLPPPPGVKSPFRIVHEHGINLPDGNFVSFACPRRMAKKACIVCTKADQLKGSGNPADYDRAKELFPRKRVYANVVDRNDEGAGVKLLAFGKTIHDDLVSIRKDQDFGGDFTHPETGFDIKIMRKGTTRKDTEYKCKPTRQSPLGNMDWLDQQHDLSVFARVLTEEQIRERLGATKGGGEGQSQSKPEPEPATVVDSTFEEVGDEDGLPF